MKWGLPLVQYGGVELIKLLRTAKALLNITRSVLEGSDEAVTCVAEAFVVRLTCAFVYSNTFNSNHIDDFDTFSPFAICESRLSEIFHDMLRRNLQFFV